MEMTKQQMRQTATQAEAMLKALANANRLMILCQLVMGEKTVSELADVIDLSQSALSQHLARMREAGLVQPRKEGQKIYYRLASPQAQAVLTLLHALYCRDPDK